MEAPPETSKPAEAKPSKTCLSAPTGRFALGTASSIKKRTDVAPSAELGMSRSSLTKSTSSMNAAPVQRRSSTGSAGKQQDNGRSVVAKKASPSLSDGVKKSKPVSASLVSSKSSLEKKSSVQSERAKVDTMKKPAVKPSPISTLKKVPSLTENSSSSASSSFRRAASNTTLNSPRSPSVTSSVTKKVGSRTSSMDKGSSMPIRKKSSTADSRDSRFMMLPQVDLKASDEVVSVEKVLHLCG